MSYPRNAYLLRDMKKREPDSLQSVFFQPRKRLMDYALFGDSNTLFGGHGWDTGWWYGLLQYFQAYATGLHSQRENGGIGQSVGYGVSSTEGIRYRAMGAVSTSTGILPDLAAWWDHDLDPRGVGGTLEFNHFRHYWATASGNMGVGGLRLYPGCPIGLGSVDQLQSTVWLGQVAALAGGGAGGSSVARFRWLRDGESATLATVNHSVVAPGKDTFVEPKDFDLPLGSYSNVTFRQQAYGTETPFYASGLRVQIKNRTSGFAVSSMYAVGGASMADCSLYTTAYREQWKNYFDMLMRHQRVQGQDPMLCCIISYGTNTGGLSDAQYKTELDTTIDDLIYGWTQAGYPEENLSFILMPSHPESSDDSKLAGKREKAREIAKGRDRTFFVDMRKLTSYAELSSSAADPYVVDGSHMRGSSGTDSSYGIITRRLLDSLLKKQTTKQGRYEL